MFFKYFSPPIIIISLTVCYSCQLLFFFTSAMFGWLSSTTLFLSRPLELDESMKLIMAALKIGRVKIKETVKDNTGGVENLDTVKEDIGGVKSLDTTNEDIGGVENLSNANKYWRNREHGNRTRKNKRGGHLKNLGKYHWSSTRR